MGVNGGTDQRLGEHIQTPRTHLSIGGHRYEVVGILGSDNIDAVDWMLDGNGTNITKKNCSHRNHKTDLFIEFVEWFGESFLRRP